MLKRLLRPIIRWWIDCCFPSFQQKRTVVPENNSFTVIGYENAESVHFDTNWRREQTELEDKNQTVTPTGDRTENQMKFLSSMSMTDFFEYNSKQEQQHVFLHKNKQLKKRVSRDSKAFFEVTSESFKDI